MKKELEQLKQLMQQGQGHGVIKSQIHDSRPDPAFPLAFL